mgnify:CR=1 FL=1
MSGTSPKCAPSKWEDQKIMVQKVRGKMQWSRPRWYVIAVQWTASLHLLEKSNPSCEVKHDGFPTEIFTVIFNTTYLVITVEYTWRCAADTNTTKS